MYDSYLIQTYQRLNQKISNPMQTIKLGELQSYNLLKYFFNQEQFSFEEQKIAKGLVAKMLKNKK